MNATKEKSMKAVGYKNAHEIDDSPDFEDIELPKPPPTGHDLLVKVDAVSVNPVDAKVRRTASAKDDEYKVLGWDAVGEVVAAGEQTTMFRQGERVWYAGDITRQGSNSEYQLVDERIVANAPAKLSAAEAAAMPLTAITAWELLFDRLDLSENQSGDATLLVIGAAGGVGSILVQLAKKLTNATVIATASREASINWVKKLGADHVINHHEQFTVQLNALGIQHATHVANLTHIDQHFDQIADVIAPQGKLGLIDSPQNIDIMKLKNKSVSIHWEFMFTRSMFQTDDIEKQHELLTRVSEMVDAGKLITTLGKHFGKMNAENLTRAHTYIERGESIGKIVLEGF